MLSAVFISAFAYRLILLLLETYPPGSDIGFHAGVINSITMSGYTNFLFNPYQMGGGVELEFPGFHIFASEVMILTGLPNFVAQALVAALISSLTVLAVFLVTRIAWNESAALIVAFFVAVSRSDIEILCWGGYPNIVALFLMATAFYLFLKKDQISRLPLFAAASLLVSSIFIVHSVSAAIFLGITASTLLAILVFPKALGESRKSVLYWILPVFAGLILATPFLVTAVPVYLGESGVLAGSQVIAQALLVHRTIPTELAIVLFASIVPFFLFSKSYRGRFFALPAVLLVMWLFIPLLLTQDYLFGLYFDSVRFLYFLMYPVFVLLAVIIDYSARHLANLSAYASRFTFNWKNRLSQPASLPKLKISGKTKPVLYASFALAALLIVTADPSISSYPADGVGLHNFYQIMNDDGYQAIEWIKQNTPADSVFASDMSFGWWLAGVGQRPTITYIPFQAISLAREVDISRNVYYLLDTDYVVDNGYIQVREDGGYLGRHNPQFLAHVNWTNLPYSFFHFNSSQITVFSRDGKGVQSSNVAEEMQLTDMRLDTENSDRPATIFVSKTNTALTYSEVTTVTKGKLFANFTITVQSSIPDLYLNSLKLTLNSAGVFQQPFSNTLAAVDAANKEFGQLIFSQETPAINPLSPCTTELSFDLQGKSKVEIQILVGLFPIAENELKNPAQFQERLSVNIENPPEAPELPITTFDYKAALQQYNVSYIANRNFELYPKFSGDPSFSLVFSNNEVAVFRVEKDMLTP